MESDYFDIATQTKRMKIPESVTLPVSIQMDSTTRGTQEVTYTPKDQEWPDALQRWAYISGYMQIETTVSSQGKETEGGQDE